MRRVILPNGLRLIVREMRSSPVAALNLWVGSGSSDEPDELSGISHFMEHLLFKGSAGEDASGRIELAREVHDAGGYLNAETGCDHTMYYQVVPGAGWRDVLRTSALALSSPAFREAEVEAERAVVVEEARSGESDPGVFVWRRLMEAALSGRPCGRPIVGTVDTVTNITPDDLRRHHSEYHRAGNLVQVVVGDVDADEVVEVASEVLGALPEGVGRERRTGAPREKGLRALTFEGGIEQPYIALAFEGPHALDVDVPAVDALCGLLGAGHSSRLWRSLHSRDGAVSDVGAGLVAYRDSGLIVARAVATSAETDRVVEGVFREVERLRSEPPSAEEMEKSLRRLESAYALEHETADSIARTLGYFETLGDYRWAEEYVDRLALVRPDHIARVAKRYLDPELATVICYVPGTSGSPGTSDSRSVERVAETRAVIDRVTHAFQGVTREAPARWSPPAAFTRPNVLGESGKIVCRKVALEGGGKLIVRPSRSLPLVSLTLGFPGGFLQEPRGKSGLTYLTQRMCREGAGTRSADDISDAIEGLGSGLAFAVERDGLGAGFTVMSKHLDVAMGILGEVLVDPTFPEERLEHVRLQVASEIREIDDHPIRRALRMLLPLAFPGLPHGRPIRGTYDTIGGMTASELADWHGRVCVSDRLVACAVGDVSPARASDIVSEALNGLSSSHEPAARTSAAGDSETERSAPPGSGAGGSNAAARPSGQDEAELVGSPQSVVAVALPGPVGGTRDAVVCRLIVRALSTIGGRLWRSLREKPPHAYHVGGTLLAYREAGAIIAYATAAPGTEESVVEGLAAEFSKLVESGLEPEELARTKRQFAGTLEISLMRGASRSATYAMAEVMGAGYEYIDRMSGEAATITNDDIVNVATSLLDPSDGFARVVLRGRSL